MSKLFEPLQIRNVQLKNRIVMSPMCQYSSEDGFANNWHLVHLGTRAMGGTALVFTEATAVSAEGRITPQDLGIYKDEHVPGLQGIVQFIRQQGAVAGIQLAHAGRKASHLRPWEGNAALQANEGAWPTLAPSAVPYKAGEPVPQAMSLVQIEDVVEQFRRAAARALQAGFEIIEIHAAHGYLLNEFLSPVSNHRTDDYGGSFENRIRILLHVIAAVRTVWKLDRPLFVRLSVTDWVPHGWTVEDSIRLSKILKEHEVDLIDCSSGGNAPEQQIPVGPLYQTPFAGRIKKEAGILTGAVGLITTSQQANAIIEDGAADLVFLGRQLLREPYFALHAAHELHAPVNWPPQYERAARY